METKKQEPVMDNIIARYVKVNEQKQEADLNHNPDDWHAQESASDIPEGALMEEEPVSEEFVQKTPTQSRPTWQPEMEEVISETVSQQESVEVQKPVSDIPVQEPKQESPVISETKVADGKAMKWYEEREQRLQQMAVNKRQSEVADEVEESDEFRKKQLQKQKYQRDIKELQMMGMEEPEEPEEMIHAVKKASQVIKATQSSVKHELQQQKRQGGNKELKPGKNGALIEPQVSVIKGIPRPLIERIMVEFDGKPKNQTDALVAWVVCHGSESMITALAPYLTTDQMVLIEGWENSPQIEMQRKMDDMLRRMQKMSFHLDTIKLLLANSAFDRLGFRMEQPENPRAINYMEDGVVDALIRAEEQTGEMRYERTRQTGRTKR